MDNQETPTVDAPAIDVAPVKTPTPRRAALKVKFADGSEKPLLRYAFPVKANTFNLKVNGVDCKAAATAGRGNAYVYVMVNNDSFYFAGTIEAEAELTVDFPADYVFRDDVEVRKSYYVKKRVAKEDGTTEGEAGDDSIPQNTEGEQAEAAAGEATDNLWPAGTPDEPAAAEPANRKKRR